MSARIAIVYNEPVSSRYDTSGEAVAAYSVMDSVTAVTKALENTGWKVTHVPLLPPWSKAGRRLSEIDVDIVFNLFEGFCGEPEIEPLVPEYLEKMGITVTGCPAAALRLALDKVAAKRLLATKDIATPHFQLLKPGFPRGSRLRFPCIVKPRREDASHGITPASVVSDLASLRVRVNAVADAYGDLVLVEEFITGREFNATVLGGAVPTVLPVAEIVYELGPGLPHLLTYAAKWEPESDYYRGTRSVCPADLTPDLRDACTGLAAAAFRALGGTGYARVDLRLDGFGRPHVIEINPNPDISPGAGAARQAAAAGLSYERFVAKIISLALESRRNGLYNTAYEGRR